MKYMKYSNTAKTFAIAAVTALALASAPAAKAQANKDAIMPPGGHFCLHRHRSLRRRARPAWAARRDRCTNLRRERRHRRLWNVKHQRQHWAFDHYGYLPREP